MTLFSKNGKKLVRYPPGLTQEHYSVPVGVEQIAPCAFSGARKLKSVDIPEGVSKIGKLAFSRTGLKHIDLPTTVVSTPKDALIIKYYFRDEM